LAETPELTLVFAASWTLNTNLVSANLREYTRANPGWALSDITISEG